MQLQYVAVTWERSQKGMGNREGWGAGLVWVALSLAPVVPEDTV